MSELTEPPRIGTIKDDLIAKSFRKDMPLRHHVEDIQFFGVDYMFYRAGFLAGENYKGKMLCTDYQAKPLKSESKLKRVWSTIRPITIKVNLR